MQIENLRRRGLLAMLLWGASFSLVGAHALLDHSDPRVGSTVAGPPTELLLWFTQEVEPSFSAVEVRDVNGARMDTGPAKADSHDETQLRIALKYLPAGTYDVSWQVLSADTHRTRGHFQFNVRQ